MPAQSRRAPVSGLPRGVASCGWTGLILLALACATPPPPLPPTAVTHTLAAATVRKVQAVYLHADRLDQRMIVGALDALERRFDTVRFEETETHGVLWVGSKRAQVPLDTELTPQAFEAVLSQALAFLEAEIPEELAEEKAKDENLNLELIALRGALGALDRYSTIFSGRGTEDFRIRFSGKLSGIGTRVGRRDGQFMAIKVFAKSPAEKAGLMDGDAILTIDADPTQLLTVSEAVGKIRGKPGTRVTLGILREGQELEIEIVRGQVNVPTVEARILEGDLGYARIFQMSHSTVKEFRQKVGELGPLGGLVLDLRGNSGGSMRTATTLADDFLGKQPILRVVNRRDPEGKLARNRTIGRPGIRYEFPVVILVDSATASAAEILAGAILPLPRVRLLGQTTFGKGVIQRVLPLLRSETLLKLTVGEYLLSDDRAIHEKGIEPDITLFPVSSKNLGRLAATEHGAIPYVRTAGEDDTFPIDAALELLQGGSEADLRASTTAKISEELAELGIEWSASVEGDLPDELPVPLRIEFGGKAITAGVPSRLTLEIHNPNELAIPNAWAALNGPGSYLANKLISLGTIPAAGSASGEIELTPPEGLSLAEHLVTIRVASATRALQSERTLLHVESHPPEISITVERSADDRIAVTIKNRGRFQVGRIHIGVPGAAESLEDLEAGAAETKELRLSGKTERVSVTLIGPGVRRRIDVPIPALEDRTTIVPPELTVERRVFLGRSRVRVHATSPEGLEVGWILLDGQKEIYAEWAGRSDGDLQTALEDGNHAITAFVETVGGVAVTDTRRLTAN